MQQLKKNNSIYEIICIDDASTLAIDAHNQFDKLGTVTFIRLEKNVGRSEIRNILVSKTTYEWILFLDADTLPKKTDLIDKYLNHINKNSNQLVTFGGLAYDKLAATKDNSLRYEYGNSRESIAAPIRNKSPYSSLLMSNTLVHKSIFDNVQFNNQIKLYGHEDAVFSYDLYLKNISVIHIDNPVYHTGLENNFVFLEKSKIAIENLWDLYVIGLMKPEINKLLRWALKLKKWHLLSIFSLLYIKFSSSFEKSLSKENPSLFLFDIYRLSYLSTISNTKK